MKHKLSYLLCILFSHRLSVKVGSYCCESYLAVYYDLQFHFMLINNIYFFILF